MADIKLAYGTPVTGTGGITSLASSATWVAGYEWFIADNTSTLALNRMIFGNITVGTTPTVNTEIRIYAVASFDGTIWPDVFEGTPSAETLTSDGIRAGFIALAKVIKVDSTTSNRVYPYAFGIAGLFDGIVPKKTGIFVTHNTGVALNGTAGNHTYNDVPVYATVV